MATSFVGFNNKGFWCEDAYLEVWLLFLIEELKYQTIYHNYDLLSYVINDWYTYATLGFVGCIDLDLDNIIKSNDELELFLHVANRVNKELLLDEKVSADEMQIIGKEIRGVQWIEAPGSVSIVKVGVYFVKLLESKLVKDVYSSLEYLSPDNWNSLNII
jgi:hypothetical protein